MDKTIWCLIFAPYIIVATYRFLKALKSRTNVIPQKFGSPVNRAVVSDEKYQQQKEFQQKILYPKGYLSILLYM